MAGQKRTRSGEVKSPEPILKASTTAEPTPPCAQPQLPSSTSTEAQHAAAKQSMSKNFKTTSNDDPKIPSEAKPPRTKPTSTAPPRSKPLSNNHHKLAKLPSNTSLHKRPLLHPALPTPYSSSLSPKIVYISSSTPFIPCVKRIRRLFTEIRRRETQSALALSRNNHNNHYNNNGSGASGRKRAGNAIPNGRLDARDIERDIVRGVEEKMSGRGEGSEEVFLKASGRAIPRALEVALLFQADEEYRVRVEMGSVSAIDDIKVRREGEDDEEGARAEENDGETEDGEELPESRLRTLSCVTVSISTR